jgi:hypothetical protein
MFGTDGVRAGRIIAGSFLHPINFIRFFCHFQDRENLEEYFPQLAKNCPLLSRIKFNTRLYVRNVEGGFSPKPKRLADLMVSLRTKWMKKAKKC